MSKKLIALLICFLLLLAAALIPEKSSSVLAVVHQHKVWPGESSETTGLADDGTLSTNLPIFIIHSDGAQIPGANLSETEDLYCDYSIVHNANGVNRSDDAPVMSGRMAIAVRGNSSRHFDKKQYGVKCVDQQNQQEQVGLLDLPAQSHWVLNGSYIDHSMIRNYLMYNLCGEILDDYVPRCRLCEVMISDAQGNLHYEGVYTLIEKVCVDKRRLNLTPYDPKYQQTSFLVQMNSHIDRYRIEHLKPDDISAYAYDLEYPNPEILTQDSLDYIKNQLLRFEKSLHDAYNTGNWAPLEKIIDLDSFVDYYIINEFFQNYDAGMRSTYIYQDLGGKICIGPVWDFDGTFNNFDAIDMKDNLMEMKSSLFYAFLTQDAHFNARCASRYRELRRTYLSDDYLIDYIDDVSEYLGHSAMRNCDRWYHGQYDLYTEDLEQMRSFVHKRGAWMDEHFILNSTVIR